MIADSNKDYVYDMLLMFMMILILWSTSLLFEPVTSCYVSALPLHVFSTNHLLH